jgi:glycosyltransferase AglD
MLIDFIIPTYNEESIIVENSIKLKDYLDKKGYEYRIIIADNGSNDDTSKKIIESGIKNLIINDINQKGRGRALKKVYFESKADIMFYMDADLSTDLDHIPQVIDKINIEGYQIVTGSRLSKNSNVSRSKNREFLSRYYNMIIRLILGIKTKDSQCGFKAITKEFRDKIIKKCRNTKWFFDTEMIVLAEKNHIKVGEVPIKWSERKESKVKIIETVLEYLKEIFILRLRLFFDKNLID